MDLIYIRAVGAEDEGSAKPAAQEVEVANVASIAFDAIAHRPHFASRWIEKRTMKNIEKYLFSLKWWDININKFTERL